MRIVLGIGGILIVLALAFGFYGCSSSKSDDAQKQEVQQLQQEMDDR